MALKEQQNYAGQQDCCARVVEARGELLAPLAFCCLESLEFGSCHVSGDARVAARRISSTNLFARLVTHAGNIVALERASVVPAWSGRSENTDLFALDVELERVLGVDAVYGCPAELVTAQWVDDLDTFVAEDDLGAHVDKPGATACETGNSGSNESCSQVALKQHLNEYANENCPDDSSKDVAGTRAEGFDVVHRTIFSQSFTETLSTTEGSK